MTWLQIWTYFSSSILFSAALDRVVRVHFTLSHTASVGFDNRRTYRDRVAEALNQSALYCIGMIHRDYEMKWQFSNLTTDAAFIFHLIYDDKLLHTNCSEHLPTIAYYDDVMALNSNRPPVPVHKHTIHSWAEHVGYSFRYIYSTTIA